MNNKSFTHALLLIIVAVATSIVTSVAIFAARDFQIRRLEARVEALENLARSLGAVK